MANGKFITLEGGEGSGKSTQAGLLAARLSSGGIKVDLTREPGGTAFGEHLRTVVLNAETPDHNPLSEALLFYAARADHLQTKIRPSLKAGNWVVCDRFADSSRAYQGYAGALDLAALDRLDQLVVAPTFPDLTLVIDVDPTVGMQRADARRSGSEDESDRFEKRDRTFHDALRRGFLEIAKENPGRCVVIDGSGDAAAISEAIWQAVRQRLMHEAHR